MSKPKIAAISLFALYSFVNPHLLMSEEPSHPRCYKIRATIPAFKPQFPTFPYGTYVSDGIVKIDYYDREFSYDPNSPLSNPISSDNTIGTIIHGYSVIRPESPQYDNALITNILYLRKARPGVHIPNEDYCLKNPRHCFDYLIFAEHVDLVRRGIGSHIFDFVAKLTVLKGTGFYENTTGAISSYGTFNEIDNVILTTGNGGVICWW